MRYKLRGLWMKFYSGVIHVKVFARHKKAILSSEFLCWVSFLVLWKIHRRERFNSVVVFNCYAAQGGAKFKSVVKNP